MVLRSAFCRYLRKTSGCVSFAWAKWKSSSIYSARLLLIFSKSIWRATLLDSSAPTHILLLHGSIRGVNFPASSTSPLGLSWIPAANAPHIARKWRPMSSASSDTGRYLHAYALHFPRCWKHWRTSGRDQWWTRAKAAVGTRLTNELEDSMTAQSV